MDKLPEFFWADRLTPVRFYSYPSYTKEKVYEIDVHTDSAKEKYKADIQRFHEIKVKCMAMPLNMAPEGKEPLWAEDRWDNKIVIECLTETGATIYVGFKDCIYSIGLSVRTRDGRGYEYKTIEHVSELSV